MDERNREREKKSKSRKNNSADSVNIMPIGTFKQSCMYPSNSQTIDNGINSVMCWLHSTPPCFDFPIRWCSFPPFYISYDERIHSSRVILLVCFDFSHLPTLGIRFALCSCLLATIQYANNNNKSGKKLSGKWQVNHHIALDGIWKANGSKLSE